jgi:hypothetical protein
MNGSPAEYFFAGGFVVFCRGFCEKWVFDRGFLVVWTWWLGGETWCFSSQFFGFERCAKVSEFIFWVPVLGMRDVYGPVGVNRT